MWCNRYEAQQIAASSTSACVLGCEGILWYVLTNKEKKTHLDNMYTTNSQTQADMHCQQTQRITITHTCLFNGLWLVKL